VWGTFGASGIVPGLAVLTNVGSFRKPNPVVTIDRVATLASVMFDRSMGAHGRQRPHRARRRELTVADVSEPED
jgi:hypothetical protein